MKTKSSVRFWWTLAIFGLMGQVAWVIENMYFNVFIYKMFQASAGQISAMVALSAVSATVTTLIMGALSDRIGKRKALIWLGYMLWGVSIFLFVFLNKTTLSSLFPQANAALLGANLAIGLDCLMTFFGSTANDAAFNAWLTDSATEKNRGAAEGINAMMPLIAILVVFGSFLFFDLDREESWKSIFSIIGIAVFFVGLLGLFLIKETSQTPCREKMLPTIFYGFSVKAMKQTPLLYLHMAGFAIFNVAIQIFMPYLILYYEVSLGMTNYVLIFAPAILLASLFTAFWGKVYDKKGFRFSGLWAMALLIPGLLFLFLFRSTLPVFAASLLMMCGYLSGMAVFGASIRAQIPKGMAGRFQGVRIFSQVLIPGVIGPMIGKKILDGAEILQNSDGTTSFIPNANLFLWAALLGLLVLPFFFTKGKRPENLLRTPFETKEKTPFSDYPRPLFKRDSYFCLNGAWQFAVESKKGRETLGTIRVPFPPESRLSGIERTIEKGEVLLYRKKFTLPDGFKKEKVILHFGAVDQKAEVFLNGKKVGESASPYLPFSLDVTEFLKDGENVLSLRITDDMDLSLPYGKQTNKPGGMWYTKTSGIWQTVWMESLPENPITKISYQGDLDRVTIFVEGGEEKKSLILKEENSAREFHFYGNEITISFPSPRNWSPEDPFLYEFTLLSGNDRVESYFALRKISIEERGGKKLLCLNGKPYFFHGLLDQGYFPDGVFLPASMEGFRLDILKMKECGFNMLRKHIKIEPDLFYYECDRLGMAVFQDAVNAGEYSFLRDTVLPTVGIKKGIRVKVPEKTKEAFLTCALGMQEILFSHPSVVYYTVFNEGWGQFDADETFRKMKEKDPTRIYDATSGWFVERESDVDSHHVYFKPLKLKNNGKRPLVLSEFGGYSYRVKGHIFNDRDNYGYRTFKTEKEFRAALLSLYEKEVFPLLEEGLSASVLTQVSDVEDETNGLFTYDRAYLKVSPEEMNALADTLKKRFFELFPA